MSLTSRFFYWSLIYSKDDDGPEESIHQDGFVWPNFCLSSSVLADAGFQDTDENTWYHLYNRLRGTWQWVKANYFLSVDTSAEILIKAVDVKTCARLDEYLMSGTKATNPPHFRNNLRGERASVKAKLDHEFLELNASTQRLSSTSRHKSKRSRNIAPPIRHSSSSSSATSVQPISICQSRSSSRSTSVSSSSHSSIPSVLCPKSDIITITSDSSDSDRSDIYQKPTKRRKAATPVDNNSRTTLCVTVKQEEHVPPLASTPVPVGGRQWPSDYPVLDVMRVLHSCRPPPLRTTVAKHFSFLTGIPFKSSTYYDAWDKWDNATQDQRDGVEGCGDDNLWKDFAVQVPLKKTKLKVVRQRLRRSQHTAEAEEGDETCGNVSSDSFDSALN